MTREDFQHCLDTHAAMIEEIRHRAHMLHESVNQHYDRKHPYGYHLDMVAEAVMQYGHLVCQNEHDVLPLCFGAYYHDSIEDARMTYNDVTKAAMEEAMSGKNKNKVYDSVEELFNDLDAE